MGLAARGDRCARALTVCAFAATATAGGDGLVADRASEVIDWSGPRSTSVFSAVGPADASEAVRAPGAQTPVFKGGVELIHTGVVVTDRRGNLVSDLTASDFEVVEDGVSQALQYFAQGDGAAAPALHLGLLLDVSESMADDIGFTRSAAIKFLNSLQDANDVTVVDFDTEVRSARFAQPDFARLVERVRGQKVQGFTALYDALGLYLDGAAAQDGRKVMLLYSDGGDTRSALRFNELIDLLKASDVTVYVVGAVDRQSPSVRSELGMRLARIAETTGGKAFFPGDVRELDKIYARIQSEIRAQYTLGYASRNERRDGAWRKVNVKVRRPDLRVRARQGYFAPAAP
jgi:Ca-activated chloride channel family protein